MSRSWSFRLGGAACDEWRHHAKPSIEIGDHGKGESFVLVADIDDALPVCGGEAHRGNHSDFVIGLNARRAPTADTSQPMHIVCERRRGWHHLRNLSAGTGDVVVAVQDMERLRRRPYVG